MSWMERKLSCIFRVPSETIVLHCIRNAQGIGLMRVGCVMKMTKNVMSWQSGSNHDNWYYR